MMGILRCFAYFVSLRQAKHLHHVPHDVKLDAWPRTRLLPMTEPCYKTWTQGGGRKSWPPSLHHVELYQLHLGAEKYSAQISWMYYNSPKNSEYCKANMGLIFQQNKQMFRDFLTSTQQKTVHMPKRRKSCSTCCHNLQPGSIPHPGCNRHHRELLHV